jgi:hypothetical protein
MMQQPMFFGMPMQNAPLQFNPMFNNQQGNMQQGYIPQPLMGNQMFKYQQPNQMNFNKNFNNQ